MNSRSQTRREPWVSVWDKPLAELVTSIATVEHPRLRAELLRLDDLLAAIIREDGDRFPDLFVPLRSTFACLRSNLLDHLAEAEENLFPALQNDPAPADEGVSAESRCHAIERTARTMAARQLVLRAELSRLRSVTRGYAPPEDVRPAFRELYYGLAALERDLETRMRSERDLLLRRILGSTLAADI